MDAYLKVLLKDLNQAIGKVLHTDPSVEAAMKNISEAGFVIGYEIKLQYQKKKKVLSCDPFIPKKALSGKRRVAASYIYTEGDKNFLKGMKIGVDV